MKNNLYIDGVHYLTAREAGDVLGYAPDYVSRLCREGKLRGRRAGKTWIVEADSLVPFIKAHEAKKEAWHQNLSRELKSVAGPIIVRDEDFQPLSPVNVAPRQLHILRASEKAHAAREEAQTMMITRITLSSVFAVLLLFVASATPLSTPIANVLRNTADAHVAAASFFSPIESIARASYESITSIACTITGWCDDVQPMPIVYVRAPQQPIAQAPAPTQITNNITNYIQPTVGSGSVLASGVSEQLLESRLNAMENYLTGRIELAEFRGDRQAESLADSFSDGIGGGGFDDIDITDSSFTGGSISGASISGSTLSGVTFSGAQAFDALEMTDATSTNATSTNMYVSGSFGFGTSTGLLRTTNGIASTLANGNNGQVLKMVGGNLTWSTDLTGGGGGGASFFASTTDDLAIYPADPSHVVIIGDSATTTVGNILEIAGNSLFRGAMTSYGDVTAPRFTATSSVASVFPYASTTALSTNSLCLSGECRQAWPDSAFSTTSADYWQTQRNFFSTTSADYYKSVNNFFSTSSADYWKTANNFFSTTSADAWKEQRNFFSTTSASYFLTQNQGNAFSTTSADHLLSTYNKGFFFSTTSAQHFLTQNGSLGFSTTSNDYWMTQRNFFSTTSADAWKDQRNFFSTSSANYFASIGLAFSTTSSDYWKSVNNFFSTSSADYYTSVNNFFSTTSADAWKLTRDFFSTTSASYFLSQNQSLGFSTTSANYFAASSTTIPKTYVANTFTALQTFGNASSSIFSADTICLSTDCRTAWPTAGSSFAYPFSLAGNATSTLTQFNGGLTAYASSTIGNGSQAGGLTINGGATTTGDALINGALTTGGNATIGGELTVSGPAVHLPNGNVIFTSTGGQGIANFDSTGIQLGAASVGNYSLFITPTTGQVNYLDVTGGTAGTAVVLSTGGDDADVDLALMPKGSGNVGIGTTSPYWSLQLAGTAPYLGISDTDAGADAKHVLLSNIDGVFRIGRSTDDLTSTSTLLSIDPAKNNFFSGVEAGDDADAAENSIFLGPAAGKSATNASNSNFIGNGAGNLATDANDSNFFGNAAGNQATEAAYSNFFGSFAGYQAANAMLSNFFGQDAGRAATDAHDANFFGNRAGYNAASAEYANFIGNSAGRDATAASASNFLGWSAGYGATNASNSIFIGTSAGENATNASMSLFIGEGAGTSDTVDNTSNGGTSIAIGRFSGTGGFSNSIALGRGVINSATEQLNIGNVLYATGIYNSDSQSAAPTATGRLGIGTSTPAATLSFAGASGLFASTTATSTFFGGGINLVTSSGNTGCFAVNDTCIGGGGGSSNWSDLGTFLSPLTSTDGIIVAASSTIGNGSQAGGLTISGGATTTGNAYFGGDVGIGTAGGLYKVSINAGAGLGLSVTSSSYSVFGDTTNAYGYLRPVTTSDSVGHFELGAYDLTGASQGARALALNPLGGNVGIGITSPQTKFTVSDVDPIIRIDNSDVTVAADQVLGTLDFYSNDISANGTGVAGAIKSIAEITAGTQYGMGFYTGIPGSGIAERMRISYTGNVGIGTTSPAWKLAVAGSGSFDGFARASYFSATSTTASVFPYASTTAITATTASTTNLIVSGLQDGLLKVGSSGVVSLAVAGTDYSNFAYLFPSNATSTTLTFNNGLLSTASSTFTADAFFSGGVWGSNGSVGIGTTSPFAKLSISPGNSASVTLGGTVFNPGAWIQTSSGRSGYTALVGNDFLDSSNGNGHFVSLFPYDDSTSSDDGSWKAFRFMAGATLADQFWVGRDGDGYFAGKVGIGTSTPANTLDLYATSALISNLDVGSDASYAIHRFASPTYAWTAGLRNDLSAGLFSFSTLAGGRVLNLTQAGNVGIGTTTPASLFTVGSGGYFQVNSSGANIQDVSSATYDVWLQGGADGSAGDDRNLAILGNATNDDLMINYNSEYDCVSIGGTSCTEALTVTGTISATGAITEGGSAVLSEANIDTCAELAAIAATTGSCGSFVLSASPTLTGTVSADAATLSSTLTLSGSAANIVLGSNWLSGDGDDEGVFVGANGNVGIGMTGPTGTLHVGAGADISATDTDGYLILGLTSGTNMAFDNNEIMARNNGAASSLFLNLEGGDVQIGASNSGLYWNATDEFIGIGTVTPGQELEVVGDVFATGHIFAGSDAGTNPASANTVGVVMRSEGHLIANASANASGFFGRSNDGNVLQFYSAGTQEGNISVSGTTVSYNAFTGSHYGTTEQSIERGMLVELDGTQTFKHGTSDSEPTYGVRKTSAANSSAVFGSMLSLMEPNRPHDPIENPYLIMAVGNGDMWVVQGEEDSIEPGDYLISSNLAGHAMKDPETYMVSHIVARAAQKVDWSTIPQVAGMKRAKISVTFEQFDRNAALSDVFAALATSTASSTETTEVQELATSFLSNLFARITTWLADASNGITEIFTKTLRAENVYADTVTANKLCLEDLCVTKAELQQMLNQNGATSTSTPEEPTEEPEAETPSEKPATEEPAQEPEETPDLEVPEEVPESAPEGSATPPTDDTPEPESAPEAPEEEV